MNDFNKFCAFVKCTLITADVVHYSGKQLRFDVKNHFYRIKNACTAFEKFVHAQLGEMAAHEDDINSGICNLVWQIFEMKPEDRKAFLEYINKFEYDKQESSGDTGSPVVGNN